MLEIALTGKFNGDDLNYEGKINDFLAAFKCKKPTKPSSAAPAAGSLCQATTNGVYFFFLFRPEADIAPQASLLSAPPRKTKVFLTNDLEKIQTFRLRPAIIDASRKNRLAELSVCARNRAHRSRG